MKFHFLLFFAFGCFVESSVLRHNFGIHGGNPINITEAPFMTLLRAKGALWGCGASIVHQQFLVTAAHCILVSGPLHVTVGTDNVHSGENYEIENAFVHPLYDIVTNDYDIAVVKLKKKLEWSDKVKNIEMTDSHSFDNIKNGDMLTTMGFGNMENNEKSKILLSVKVPYVDRSTCNKKFGAVDVITNQMLCAGGVEGEDSCQGDSGGPIIYQGKLAGAVSWGVGCGLVFPGVYAYLPAMREFVDNIIETK